MPTSIILKLNFKLCSTFKKTFKLSHSLMYSKEIRQMFIRVSTQHLDKSCTVKKQCALKLCKSDFMQHRLHLKSIKVQDLIQNH